MTLSPSGSDAVVTGHPGRAWSIMLIGGVLGWISGQSWSVDRGFGEAFSLFMAFGTLAVIAAPAQMTAGRAARPVWVAVAGTIGITVPWFFDLAIELGGDGVWLPTLLVLVLGFAVTYGVATVTRVAMHRFEDW
ncbi:hypothetical protein [uncultured Ornithinimicrobium sp.]|uniref:hypothetical protein n=1 Tax=uncultured Ornithinimicrobium sp. TaxID=259307 RepID=UPI00259180ED|nr:hypothetical protein [uncultured Ornithinimicrobium sp.]